MRKNDSEDNAILGTKKKKQTWDGHGWNDIDCKHISSGLTLNNYKLTVTTRSTTNTYYYLVNLRQIVK